MDTDDLSRKAYEGILIEAEKITHDLTLHYGLLSGDCKNEAEYIDKAEKMTREIMIADDWETDDLFWGNRRKGKNWNLPAGKSQKILSKLDPYPLRSAILIFKNITRHA